MTIAAQSIIRRCVETLQDKTSVRWDAGELVRYLNDGQREIVVHRPDATRLNATMALAAGAKQSLPSNSAKLIEVIRNTSGNKRAVRQASRDLLDAFNPSWQNMAGVTEIQHFTYDPREPNTFYVYPPAAGSGASLELVYSAFPTDITEPADGSLYSAVTGNLSVADIYANVVQDYILYRAFTKDATYAGNLTRAAAHFTQFANALGIEVKATVAVAPTTTGQNMAASAA